MRRYAPLFAAVAVIGAAAALLLPRHAGRPAAVSRAPAPATSPATIRLVSVEVGGMTCAACVDTVQRSLGHVPGVRRVEVSLANRRAEVLCDATVADTALTAAVRRAGPQYLGLVLGR